MTDTEILQLAKRFHAGKRGGDYIVPISKIAGALDAPYASVMRKAEALGAEKLSLGDYLFPAELLDSTTVDDDADNAEIPAAPPKSADSRENGLHNRRTSNSYDAPRVEVPREIRERDQWVIWRKETRNGKETKIPYQALSPHATAKTDTPATWAAYEDAENARQNANADGIGFVFRESDPYCGIDLDNCLKPDGLPKTWAKRIVDTLSSVSYCEISPSGTGMKFWTRAALTPDAKHTETVGDGKIEIYDRLRYFTVTANQPRGKIAQGQAEVDWIYETYFPTTGPHQAHKPAPVASAPTQSTAEILNRIRQSKQTHKFNALMNGDTTGYGSPSEADQALCSIVAFWTRHPPQIDAIFRQSQLMRPKWDEKHRGDGATYGQMTIEFALTHTTEQAKPNPRLPSFKPPFTKSLLPKF